MPYIENYLRKEITGPQKRSPKTSGELTFSLYRTIMDYVTTNRRSWQTYSDVLGALTGCTQEFYRRVVAPHEDKKLEENGDI